MRLPERNKENGLSPEIERELDAIERALAGDVPDPDPELAGLMALATEIHDERPLPREDFSAELDRLAAAGFSSGDRSPLKALRGRLARLSPTRMALPAGSLATLLIAAVVSVSVLGDDGAVSPQAGGGSDAVSSPGFEGTAAEIALDEGRAGASAIAPPSRGDGSDLAPQQENRKVDRDAFLTLSTKPDDVRETTDKAIAIVRGFGGIIASSQVSEGADGAFSFIEISLPTRNLDAALDQLTALGNVESLNEATIDITQPFVSARDRIRDGRAERRSVLDALSVAEDPEAIAELRRAARQARIEISRAKADFDNIARQARLSSISLEILGDPNAADDWSVSDALEDAEDVLRTAAGIVLVTGAILVPLTLLVLLFALALRAIRGGRRERALDE